MKVILITIILCSAGGSGEKSGVEYSGVVSEDMGVSLGSSDQQGFGISGTGGNGKSSSGSTGAGYLSPGSDISGSGILT